MKLREETSLPPYLRKMNVQSVEVQRKSYKDLKTLYILTPRGQQSASANNNSLPLSLSGGSKGETGDSDTLKHHN